MAYLRGVTTLPEIEGIRSWGRTQIIFHGWDGSHWDMTEGRNGVYLLPVGIEGLGMPRIDNYLIESPVVHGVEWEGWRAFARDTFWTVGIFQDGSLEFLEMKRAFWRIFRPGKPMRIELILPNQERYNLWVRFKEDNSSVYERDPIKIGWAIYGITAFAEQPFWEGEEHTQIWYPQNSPNFFGESSYGPPFYVGSSSDISNAKMTNPGDVETFIRWELKGPFESATVGLGLNTTTVPETPEGSTVILDTNPIALGAHRDGVDIMASLGNFEYAPLPPGEDIVLALGMEGDEGSIRATFTPMYFRGI